MKETVDNFFLKMIPFNYSFLKLTICFLILFSTFSSKAQNSISKYILFNTGDTILQSNERNKLDSLSKQILLFDEYKIILYGYTDSIGSVEYNKKLSEGRLASVEDFLVRNKIPQNKITKSAYGELRPKYKNDSETGMALNRRVDIVIKDILIDIDTCVSLDCYKACIKARTYKPYFNRDLEYTIIPIRNFGDMQKNGISAATANAGFLESDGMFLLQVKVKGKNISPVAQKSISYYIPVINYDSTMRIYNGVEDKMGITKWSNTSIKPSITKTDKCLTYSFEVEPNLSVKGSRGKNIDKPCKFCYCTPFVMQRLRFLENPYFYNSKSKLIVKSTDNNSFLNTKYKGTNFIEKVNISTYNKFQNNISSVTTSGGIVSLKHIFQLSDTSFVKSDDEKYYILMPIDYKNSIDTTFKAYEGLKEKGSIVWKPCKVDSIIFLECMVFYVFECNNFDFLALGKGVSVDIGRSKIFEKTIVSQKELGSLYAICKTKRESFIIPIEPNTNEPNKYIVQVPSGKKNKILLVGKTFDGQDYYVYEKKLKLNFHRFFSKKDLVIKKRKFKKAKLNNDKSIRYKFITPKMK